MCVYSTPMPSYRDSLDLALGGDERVVDEEERKGVCS